MYLSSTKKHDINLNNTELTEYPMNFIQRNVINHRKLFSE